MQKEKIKGGWSPDEDIANLCTWASAIDSLYFQKSHLY